MNLATGYLLAYPILGRFTRGVAHHSLTVNLGATIAIFTFLHLAYADFENKDKAFHEIMTQPNPHGSYVRKAIRHHFPCWWSDISLNLHANGYNLKEMNEYVAKTDMPEIRHKFDKNLY